MEFDDILFQSARHDASDLFIKVGVAPSLRIDGRVVFMKAEPVSAEKAESFADHILNQNQREYFNKTNEVDVAYQHSKHGRFRVNFFRQQGHIGMVLRRLKEQISSLDALNLPSDGITKMVSQSRGLILVTGIAGSGKSTALAAMIEHINQTSRKHIITIEDPIEFVYQDKKCLIDQREVGLDTKDYHAALKHCVRQSPDVILIGEMRDRETMEAAIAASETGHLVFSTLHTTDASLTLERIMNFFPPHQHDFLRTQLAMLLVGILTLRLLPLKSGQGRIPAYELMVNSPTIREMLQAGRTRDLAIAMKEGSHFGNMTFNQCLRRLYDQGAISLDVALNASDSPDELKLEIRGISRGTKL